MESKPASPAKQRQASAITKKTTVVRKELVGRALGYIIGAFGLVAALAWNDLISSIFKEFFGEDQLSVVAKLLYAIVSTFIAVLVILSLSRWVKKP